MKNKLQIVSIRIEKKTDQDPDLSFLGKFSDTFAGCEQAIVRIGGHAGKYCHEVSADEMPSKGREFRFFIPAMTGDETGNPKSPKEDFQRMEAYNSQQWEMLGIVAKAEIRNKETSITQTIRSGGLWGVESDSDKEHLASLAKEQLAELKAELLALGIGARAIAYAIKNCEI